jgi:hypothetical protein
VGSRTWLKLDGTSVWGRGPTPFPHAAPSSSANSAHPTLCRNSPRHQRLLFAARLQSWCFVDPIRQSVAGPANPPSSSTSPSTNDLVLATRVDRRTCSQRSSGRRTSRPRRQALPAQAASVNKRLVQTKPNRSGPFGPSAIDRLCSTAAKRCAACAVRPGRHSTINPVQSRNELRPPLPRRAQPAAHLVVLSAGAPTAITPSPPCGT